MRRGGSAEARRVAVELVADRPPSVTQAVALAARGRHQMLSTGTSTPRRRCGRRWWSQTQPVRAGPLEEVALQDEYFTSRELYPNVDFYCGLIYLALGFPMEMFTVLFAIPRTSGWLAHLMEMLVQDSRIARPRQLYTGVESLGRRQRGPDAQATAS